MYIRTYKLYFKFMINNIYREMILFLIINGFKNILNFNLKTEIKRYIEKTR